jgi:hypothetical protein
MATVESKGHLPASQANSVKRRGLFAAAWAAVIGLVLKYTTEPVQAAASLQFGNVASSTPVDNAAGGPTRIWDARDVE